MGFRILLTENSSPVGAALFKTLENHQHPVICPDVGWQNWCDEQYVTELLDATGPVLVINTLHYSAPEIILDTPQLSDVLATLCAQRDLTAIHLSSFEVFGEQQQISAGAASETLQPLADTALGHSLLQAEAAFAKVRRAVIVRPSRLLDSEIGMIERTCAALCTQNTVVASEHWRMTPVYIEDVVRAVIAMLQQILCGAENWGVFHLHSSDACSEAEFIDCIARNLNKMHLKVAALAVRAGQEHFFAGNAWLQGSRCTNDFGVQRRSWRKGLKARVSAWVERESEQGGVQRVEKVPTPGADTEC